MVFMPIRGAQLSLRRFLLQFGDIAWNWVYCSLKLHANIKWRCKKPMHKSCSKNIIVFRNFINIIFDTMNFVLYYLRLIVLFLCCNIQFSSKWFLKIYEKVYSIWCHIYLPGVTMNWFMSPSWIHMKLQLPTPVADIS